LSHGSDEALTSVRQSAAPVSGAFARLLPRRQRPRSAGDGESHVGLRRFRSDGASISSEYVEPYGYVIPKGKCFVVTDLSYYSGFTQPLAPGSLTKLTLGIVKVSASGWRQSTVFVTSPEFSNNKMIGSNVTMETGFTVRHGHYLSVTLPGHGDLVSTELFVYGYLKPL
jgi:hypothetical protein